MNRNAIEPTVVGSLGILCHIELEQREQNGKEVKIKKKKCDTTH